MNGLILLTLAATLGVDFSWDPAADGQLEYSIRIERELLAQIGEGVPVFTDIPAAARGGRRIRIVVKDEGASGAWPVNGAKSPLIGVTQHGSVKQEDGTLEYLIQINPDALESLKAGRPIVDALNYRIDAVDRIRVFVGTTQLPQINIAVAGKSPAISLTDNELRGTSGGLQPPNQLPVDNRGGSVGVDTIAQASFPQANVREQVRIPDNSLAAQPARYTGQPNTNAQRNSLLTSGRAGAPTNNQTNSVLQPNQNRINQPGVSGQQYSPNGTRSVLNQSNPAPGGTNVGGQTLQQQQRNAVANQRQTVNPNLPSNRGGNTAANPNEWRPQQNTLQPDWPNTAGSQTNQNQNPATRNNVALRQNDINQGWPSTPQPGYLNTQNSSGAGQNGQTYQNGQGNFQRQGQYPQNQNPQQQNQPNYNTQVGAGAGAGTNGYNGYTPQQQQQQQQQRQVNQQTPGGQIPSPNGYQQNNNPLLLNNGVQPQNNYQGVNPYLANGQVNPAVANGIAPNLAALNPALTGQQLPGGNALNQQLLNSGINPYMYAQMAANYQAIQNPFLQNRRKDDDESDVKSSRIDPYERERDAEYKRLRDAELEKLRSNKAALTNVGTNVVPPQPTAEKGQGEGSKRSSKEKPWPSLFFLFLAFCASLGGNGYLLWVSWDYYEQYRQMSEEARRNRVSRDDI